MLLILLFQNHCGYSWPFVHTCKFQEYSFNFFIQLFSLLWDCHHHNIDNLKIYSFPYILSHFYFLQANIILFSKIFCIFFVVSRWSLVWFHFGSFCIVFYLFCYHLFLTSYFKFLFVACFLFFILFLSWILLINYLLFTFWKMCIPGIIFLQQALNLYNAFLISQNLNVTNICIFLWKHTGILECFNTIFYLPAMLSGIWSSLCFQL